MNMLTCQWCGASGPPEEFELDERNGDGFWCPDCDGHTYYDQAKNQNRRMLLLLEQKGAGQPCPAPPYKFKKRLSPLRYPGGKSKLIDFLYNQFKYDQLDTFVEVFAGGASVGLALLDAGCTKRLVLNDMDPGVYALWKTIQDAPETLLERLDGAPPTRDTLLQSKAVLDAPEAAEMADLAWAELVCNRLSFSGIVNGGILGGRNGSQESLLVRWNPENLAKRIKRIHELSDRISVTQMDACKLVEDYAYWDDRATLFIDPPYVVKGKALYRCYFTEDDHRRLAWLLESLFQGMPGADIVITYDDCPLIRDIYCLPEIKAIGRFYSI